MSTIIEIEKKGKSKKSKWKMKKIKNKKSKLYLKNKTILKPFLKF